LGLIPYDVYLYERNRRHEKPYSRSENIGGLYREATRVHGYRQSPRLQRQMIQYARNLSLKGHRCSPGLYQVVLSAKSMEDDRYARDVLETARSYHFYQPDESLQTLSGNEKGAEKDGKTVEITLQVPNEDSLRRIGPLEQLNFRTGRRENPYKDQAPDGSYSRQWGRYDDEMVREERFLKRLETIACQQSGSERESRPFSGGLMDGLDVGRTLRFLHEDRIYVRKRPPEPEPYDAIIVDYASLEGKPVTWAGGCYTYGYHKGFGWQSRATKTGEGIGRARWHYLCSYKRAFEGDQHVIESTDRMLERRADGETIAEAFFTTAINRAPGNRILYVGATVPRILNHYRSTQRIDTLGFARLDESLLRKLQSFNLYYYPRSKTQ
jgi:hypothetical protein